MVRSVSIWWNKTQYGSICCHTFHHPSKGPTLKHLIKETKTGTAQKQNRDPKSNESGTKTRLKKKRTFLSTFSVETINFFTKLSPKCEDTFLRARRSKWKRAFLKVHVDSLIKTILETGSIQLRPARPSELLVSNENCLRGWLDPAPAR